MKIGKRRKRRFFRLKREPKIFLTTFKKPIPISLWKIFSLLTLLLALLCIYLALRTDIFLLKKIHLEDEISPSLKGKLQKLIQDKVEGESIFFLSLEELKKEVLTNFPEVKDIFIKKTLPNQLLIKIVERKPVAILQTTKLATASGTFPKNYFLVDNEGFVFAKTATFSGLPLLYLPDEEKLFVGKKINQKGVKTAGKIITLLEEKGISVEKVFLPSPGKIEVLLKEKIKTIFTSQKDPSLQVTSLQIILSSLRMEGKVPKEVDLRFERPVVKF